jgi:hypothetical protein
MEVIRAEGGKSGMTFGRLFSRVAFIASITYAAIAVGMIVYVWHRVEPEGVPFAFLVFGFPWSLVAVFTKCASLRDGYCLPLVLILNTATLYAAVLTIDSLKRDSK